MPRYIGNISNIGVKHQSINQKVLQHASKMYVSMLFGSWWDLQHLSIHAVTGGIHDFGCHSRFPGGFIEICLTHSKLKTWGSRFKGQ
jgi:hypothetical protein